jgi:hypothetical protein
MGWLKLKAQIFVLFLIKLYMFFVVCQTYVHMYECIVIDTKISVQNVRRPKTRIVSLELKLLLTSTKNLISNQIESHNFFFANPFSIQRQPSNTNQEIGNLEILIVLEGVAAAAALSFFILRN